MEWQMLFSSDNKIINSGEKNNIWKSGALWVLGANLINFLLIY